MDGMRDSIQRFKQLCEISHKAKPGHIAVVSIHALISAMLTVVWSTFPAGIARQLEEQNGTGLIAMTCGLVLFNVIALLLQAFLDQKIKMGNRVIKNEMNRMIDAKILSISFVQTENPKILDLKEQAIWTFENYGGITYLIQHLVLALSALISIVIYLVMLSSMPAAIVVIIFYSLIALLAGKKKRIEGVQYWEETSRLNRWFLYLTWQIAHNYHVGKEIRLYNGSSMVLNRMEEMRESWKKTEENYASSTGRCNGLIEGAGLVIVILAILWLGGPGKTSLSLSLVILCVTVLFEMPSLLSRLVLHATETFQLCDFGQHFLDFIDLPNDQKVHEKVSAEMDYIEIKHASFRYPEEEKEAVQDVSFRINKGEKIAIVGRNGAGKSTLIKMLCALYHTREGEINFVMENGQCISPEDYIGKSGVVFQDFKILPVSLKENILMGRNENKERLEELIAFSKLKDIVTGLARGSDTVLSKAIDAEGTDLSGGENQEVAIARAKYGNTGLLILDEPNSALDVYAEEQLYLDVARSSQKDTVIFVSHRLSACKFCDRIIVMKDGKVIEEGSHAILMRQQGEYYELYQAQAELYQNKLGCR